MLPLEAFKNIPRSTLQFGKDIWQAVRHPVQTGKALGSVALGASMIIASKNSSAFTVTATDFAAGDELLVTTQAGTVDTSGILGHLTVGWVENFPSTADPVTGL